MKIKFERKETLASRIDRAETIEDLKAILLELVADREPINNVILKRSE